MDAPAVIAIVLAVVVVLGALSFVTLARRSDVRGAGALSGETRRRDRAARAQRSEEPADEGQAVTAHEAERAGELARYGTDVEPVQPSAPVAFTPPDPEVIGVSRRQFFNRATVSLMSAGIGAFSAASIVAFLWPTGSGGFGGQISLGALADIKAGIADGGGFFYAADARTWVTEYPPDALPSARAVYTDPAVLAGMEAGIVTLYQKCPHLGCRVPSCETSKWFECGCHGSQYNQVGEKQGGPAPRGMDHFPPTISAGSVTVDTGTVINGAPIGTDTTGQAPEGPHCVGSASH